MGKRHLAKKAEYKGIVLKLKYPTSEEVFSLSKEYIEPGAEITINDARTYIALFSIPIRRWVFFRRILTVWEPIWWN